MEFFEYRADILPKITLININKYPEFQRNIHRTSEDYIFYFMKSGEMYFKEDGIDYVIKKGDTFLFEPGKEHFGTKDTKYSFYYIHFKHPNVKKTDILMNEFVDKIRNSTLRADEFKNQGSIIIPKMMNFSNNSEFLNLCNLCEKAINNYLFKYDGFEPLTSCSVNEVFITAFRNFIFNSISNGGKTDIGISRINLVMEFLNNNFYGKITSQVIEQELSYNFDYLNQLFKKYLHTSIFKTLENIRIENAINRLKNTDLTINMIAQEVGYEDGSYFSKAFKKHTGFSPSSYRNNQGADSQG